MKLTQDPTKSEIVNIKEVSKNFGSFQAVTKASFSIQKGECFGLLGPNGAGKSTLIRMIYGATSRSGGEISILGLDPQTQGRELRKRIGVVTQEDALDEQMSVVENMRMYARFIGLPKATASQRIDQLLDFLSLTHKADAKIQALSGGMRRRLVFVRALLPDPELLILDEPTTGLDPAVRQVLWDKIRSLKRQGTTVILTTHYMDEAELLCDRMVVVDHGEIKIQGSPRELIHQYCPGFVALWSSSLATANNHALSERRMEARSLHELADQIEKEQIRPDIIRPSNLEDVFLKVTGRELTSDA